MIEIIRCNPSHVEKLMNIGYLTFSETFAEINTEEDMQQYLQNTFTEEKITDEISNKNSWFYIAQTGDEVIGYLKINFADAQTELKDENALEIERIYIKKAHLGKQVGKLLLDEAMTVARQHSLQYVWLGVWENNERAIKFYEKQGFEKFGTHIFVLGKDEQTDNLMKLILK
ncbi:MAG: GNAT family N-acetyltransferase [Verrucomicrobia bacterium]|nr:GNAT family N-acetyltransferase [Cytophagales bacterium]